MRLYIFLLIFWTVLLFPNMMKAQETEETFYDFYAGLSTLKNPFKVKLPEAKQPVKQSQVEKKKEEARFPDLKVYGLVWDTDKPQAIINNQVVNIRDTIEGVTVTDISSKGVEVQYAGRKVIIKPK